MQIDIVIVSCSCFAPTPSMAAMIVNHFKLRRDVLTYNLSGMGCSSSLICIDMVKHLLKVSLSHNSSFVFLLAFCLGSVHLLSFEVSLTSTGGAQTGPAIKAPGQSCPDSM